MEKVEFKTDDLSRIHKKQRGFYVAEHIRRNIERTIMQEIEFRDILWEKYDYDVKEEGSMQIVNIDIAYVKLTDMRFGDTWGCKMTDRKEAKKFVFEARKSEAIKEGTRIYFAYTLECVIRKIVLNDNSKEVMKFTKKSLIETLRMKTEGKSSYRARRMANVSVRRVDEIWKEYLMTGEIPVIGKAVGRPMIPIENWERELVKRFYEKYRVSA